MNQTFPNTRLRRSRISNNIRDIIAETSISKSDVILPIFIIEGSDIEQKIDKMPDVYRYSVDVLIKKLDQWIKLGLSAIALFPYIDISFKTEDGSYSYDENNLVNKTVRKIKKHYPELVIICDVALDPYTIHGHDGIVINNYVDNDITNQILCKQAISLAQSGADIVAPSDMMDGRIGQIRENLESEGFPNTLILSYSAKYASNFYGAFRNAVGSDKQLKTDKKNYQMDYRNSNEALREISLDIQEGADIIMVKPGLHYLDIIRTAKDNFNIPIFAYHVSSEYSMLKLASSAGILSYEEALLETIYSFKRSGCSSILTYCAIDLIKLL